YGSFTAASLEHGGYANNDARGKSDGDRDTVAWRASLVRSWDSGLSVALAMDLSEDRPETSRTPVLATSSDVAPGEPTPKSADPFRVNADFNGLNKLAVSGASAHVSLPVNDEISLKSITSYRGLKYQSHLDLDATDRGTFGVFVDQTQSQYSQELQMNYEGGPYKIVLGYYVLRENDENENGIYAPEYTLNGAAATAFNLPDGTPFPYSTNSLNDQVTSSEAFYVDVAIELYEKVNMSIGMRRTDETKVLKRAYRELFQSQPPYKASVMIGGRGNNFDAGMTRSYSDFSPRLTVDYEFSDTVNGYVSYSQGFKAGGFDGRADTVAEIRPYRPEKLAAREVGLKGSADGEVPVVFNIALFSNDYRDLQVSSFGANSTGGFQAVFSNAARASFTGLEIEFTAHLSDDLRLDMMLGTLNASYGSFIQDGENLAQRLTPVNAPSRVARVAAQYERSFGSGLDAVFSLGLNHRGEVYPTVSSSEAVHQSAYTLIDMAATLKMNEGRREVKFVGRNLRDKAYINHAFDLSANPGYQLAYYGAPMNYSFSYIVRM
ncbi:MAG: TonB-dependent receptor, partial [Gammaproteobacteria bacterium AqS3]|nr:TonB-dependent receptor [Gammaproteobacteria bacterium AqS3]